MTTQFIPVFGDSQTDYFSMNTRPGITWPFRFERELVARGASPAVMSFGESGDTSGQGPASHDVLDRMHGGFRMVKAPLGDPACVPVPLAAIYVGVNDPNTIGGWTQSVTQTNIEATIMAFRHGAFGSWHRGGSGRGMEPLGPAYAATVSALPNDGQIGQRLVVLSDTDTSTTNGYLPNAALVTAGRQAANVAPPASGSISVWEYRVSRAGNLGWGRVVNSLTAAPTFCPRVIVISTNYLNWTTGGDTPAGATPSGSPFASYASVRTAQLAAVTATSVAVSGQPSVIYTDLYGYQRRLITGAAGGYGGNDPDTGSAWAQKVPNFSADATIVASASYDATQDWHYIQNNQHHGAFGHNVVAKAIMDGGPNGTAFPAAWITALT